MRREIYAGLAIPRFHQGMIVLGQEVDDVGTAVSNKQGGKNNRCHFQRPAAPNHSSDGPAQGESNDSQGYRDAAQTTKTNRQNSNHQQQGYWSEEAEVSNHAFCPLQLHFRQATDEDLIVAAKFLHCRSDFTRDLALLIESVSPFHFFQKDDQRGGLAIARDQTLFIK